MHKPSSAFLLCFRAGASKMHCNSMPAHLQLLLTGPFCMQDTNGDLVGLGFRVGLYMLGISHLVIYARGASTAAAGQSQLTMISYFAVFVTLYTHGVGAVTDIEFVTISYLLGLFGIIAHVDFHAYLAHGNIKTESWHHRVYFVSRFLLVSVTSIFTWGMLLAFWATEFREIRCGTDETSAFLFAQVRSTSCCAATVCPVPGAAHCTAM